MASDSRIKFANSFADVGVKVMRLPIHAYGTGGGGVTLNTLLRKHYGFCYSGSLANAATFKALIEDLLDGVQFVGDEHELSFDNICEFVRHYCNRISTEMCACMFENGQYGFFLAGYCPLQSRLRAAVFTFQQDNGESVAQYTEVVKDEGSYEAIGTGADEARRLVTCISFKEMLLLLNRVIDEGHVPSVGGDIQYGSFGETGDFSVYGVIRISQEHVDDGERKYGPSELRMFKYRGFQLYEDWKFQIDKFWPSPGFIELKVPSNEGSQAYFIQKCREPISGR